MQKLILIALCLYGMVASLHGQTYTLKAKNYDGKTQYFVMREASWQGEEVWGIKGEGTTGQVHSGDMWFNSFPGATGKYKVEIGGVLEPDGDPEYAVTAGSRLLKKGRYPYPSGQSTYQCDGGTTEKAWINIGEHTINNGEKINFWGKSLYYCGSGTDWHGVYTRWFELKFTKVGGTTGPATKITAPVAGANLEEGKEYTLTAEGTNVSWSYDANSDGLGETNIGTGNSVKFTIPTGVTGERKITINANGDNGSDQVICNITAAGILDWAFPSSNNAFGLTSSPDPFTVSTEITFSLPHTGHTTMLIYSGQGQAMHTLLHKVLTKGPHSVPFRGSLNEGVYYLVLEHPAGTQVNRMMVVK